jgi:hypothetical protein
MRAKAENPAVTEPGTAVDLAQVRLQDVLGDVLLSYPLSFCSDPGDEEVERELLDREIFTGLVAV